MPFPNEHAARLKSPGLFKRFRRRNNAFGSGIDAVFGVRDREGKEVTELQSIRFDSSKFTVKQARKWLSDHDHKPILFEPATGDKQMKTKDPKQKNDVSWMDGPQIDRNARRTLWCPNPELSAKELNHEFGSIEGHAAVWNKIDLQDEIIRKGAFKKSIDEGVPNGKVKLMVRHFAHGGDVPELIGSVADAREDNFGLWFDGPLSSVKLAQDTRALVLEGHVDGASVGFMPIKWNLLEIEGKKIVEHVEAKLVEITITARPAMPDTKVTAKELTGDEKALSVKEFLAAADSYICSLSLDDSSRLAAEKERAALLCKSLGDMQGRLIDLLKEPQTSKVEITDDRMHSMRREIEHFRLEAAKSSLGV